MGDDPSRAFAAASEDEECELERAMIEPDREVDCSFSTLQA